MVLDAVLAWFVAEYPVAVMARLAVQRTLKGGGGKRGGQVS